MRRSVRCKNKVETEHNFLASVSDLTSALLFVFIIALAGAIIQAQKAANDAVKANASAIQYADQARKTRDELSVVNSRLQGNNIARGALIGTIQEQMTTELKVHVNIDSTKGVLRVPEAAISFETGSAKLNDENLQRLEKMGNILAKTLPCFRPVEKGATRDKHCIALNPNGNILDAVFIEGHTDNQSFYGDTLENRNRMLSTSRSNAVYQALVLGNPLLSKMKNSKDESLFSISGYGADRPLPGHYHETPTSDAANRRIEFRFIFEEPKISTDEAKLISTDTFDDLNKDE